MQTNSNEPIVTFSVAMSQEDAAAWIMEKAAELQKLAALKAKQADLQRQLEKLDDDIFEQSELCRVIISA
ncbi:hypothetical protein [Providencia rettgeri]|uniref:hypothetical protein n=1 Tax=Providencia rettgeri TaxID=587 RepID=UPI00029BBBD4|nr:hypothetical protein [Providencia rettgeri]EKT54488.1 hypothetical protein OOC_13049 [Providencia rettgeri Dmel1]MBG5930228.1 hypothetical protein [Providencia rettgeri]MCL0020588.1 hypothetical protein [Providencia rettgeri]QKG44801.1 hypothetical protein HRD55_09485 [Providencia rettgeri]QNN34934.1 hypothetical protein H9X60_09490 [Providencia rettgeri]